MRPRVAAVLAAVAAALAGCSAETDDARIEVVATTTQAGDLARQVAGNRVRVRVLLRPGIDPHDYEPRPSDARALAGARVVVRSGGEVDAWLGDLLESAGGDPDVVVLLDDVRAERREGEIDPHWWQDPRRAAVAVQAIGRELTAADPQNGAGFQGSADAYAARLRRLDARIAECVGLVPAERRKIVTTHDSLGYFARRYGIEIVGSVIPALSSQAQPSAGETARLVERIRSEGVRAIFPESALDPRLERAIARDAGARVGGELWADSLGPRGSSGDTYERAMRANADTIVRGMSDGAAGCPAPGR